MLLLPQLQICYCDEAFDSWNHHSSSRILIYFEKWRNRLRWSTQPTSQGAWVDDHHQQSWHPADIFDMHYCIQIRQKFNSFVQLLLWVISSANFLKMKITFFGKKLQQVKNINDFILELLAQRKIKHSLIPLIKWKSKFGVMVLGKFSKWSHCIFKVEAQNNKKRQLAP